MKKLNVAVVGATGAVGKAMIRVLQERNFPLAELHALATPRSAGTKVEGHTVQSVEEFDFGRVSLALFAGGEVASSVYAPRANESGATVVDNSATYRMDPTVPLVVPEVNPHHLGSARLVANPNCSTIQMVVALAPLHRAAGLKRVIVTTFQSVSGTGKDAIDELQAQAEAYGQGQPMPQAKVYPRQIAFNLLPQIASFQSDGFTGEERKMMDETRKIMDLPGLAITATCVRVPVFYAHSESVAAEFERPLSVEDARKALSEAPGVILMDDPSKLVYPTPLDAQHQDQTLVGRLRQDPSVANGLNFWVVADNLRKGAATNAVQIAEALLEQGKL